MQQVGVPMARPDPAYNGRVVSGPGTIRLWFLHGPLQMNQPNFSHIQGERFSRPLMTSTATGQGSSKSVEKSMERHES